MSTAETPERELRGRMVRPYTMTGGRVGTRTDRIALEALVAATPDGMRRRSEYRWESAEIVARSRQETAVIELAALLEVPIGVVKVLVADLREQGAVSITDPPLQRPTNSDGEVYTDLLQKVLDGIKSL